MMDEKIENEIKYICERYLMVGNFEDAKKALYRTYLKEYNNIITIVTKRNLLYRLIIAEENTTNNIETIKLFSKQLFDEMNNITNYKELFTEFYIDISNYYCSSHEQDLSKEELLKEYSFSYDYYKKIYEICNTEDCYLKMMIAKFNIDRTNDNYEEMINIVMELYKEDDLKYQEVVIELLNKINKTDCILYFKILKMVNLKYKTKCI